MDDEWIDDWIIGWTEQWITEWNDGVSHIFQFCEWKSLQSQVLMFDVYHETTFAVNASRLIPPPPRIRQQPFYVVDQSRLLFCLLWDIPELLPQAGPLSHQSSGSSTLQPAAWKGSRPCQMPPGGLPRLERLSEQKYLGVPPPQPQSVIWWHKSTWGGYGHFPSQQLQTIVLLRVPGPFFFFSTQECSLSFLGLCQAKMLLLLPGYFLWTVCLWNGSSGKQVRGLNTLPEF